MKEQTSKIVQKQTGLGADQTERDSDEKWLENFKKTKGMTPPPFRLMALRPGTVSAFMPYRNQVLQGGPLGKKEIALLEISVSVALNSPVCIHNHAIEARKAGASEDEIIQAAIIAGLMCGMMPLRAAFDGIVESSND
jgi:AhpD family alkylhydroperoxidase